MFLRKFDIFFYISDVSHGKESPRLTSRKSKFQQQNPSIEKGFRQRFSHSQSSYSDEECQKPSRDKPQRSKSVKQEDNLSIKEKSSCSNAENIGSDVVFDMSKSQKPPLPPFRTALPKTKISLKISKEMEEGDESWDDVTTSGTESVGDDCSSLNPSPKRLESFNSESECDVSDSGINLKDPTDIYTPEDFIQLVPSEGHLKEVDDCYNLPVTSLKMEIGTSDLETLDVIETKSSDIYTPEDFIRLVPSDIKDSGETVINNTPSSSETKKVTTEQVATSNLCNKSDDILKCPSDTHSPDNIVECVQPDVNDSSHITSEKKAIVQLDNNLINESKNISKESADDSENLDSVQACHSELILGNESSHDSSGIINNESNTIEKSQEILEVSNKASVTTHEIESQSQEDKKEILS